MCADEVLARGRRALEDHERADVHVGRLLLLVEEGGVDRAQPVLVSLLGHVMNLPATIASVKLLGTVLALQVVLGIVLVVLVATDNLPFVDDEADGAPAHVARPTADRFDSAAAWKLLREQVELGPRPAGSETSRELARRLQRLLPNGRFQRCRAACATWSGRCRGREPGYIVVGAHYDTKDIPGFVGANDGASGTAVARRARARRSKRPRPHDHVRPLRRRGEPARRAGRELRASAACAAARSPRGATGDARAMVLLDFVGDQRLSIPREGSSDADLWRGLRAAAKAVGRGPRTSRPACAARSSTTTSRSSSRACRRST